MPVVRRKDEIIEQLRCHNEWCRELFDGESVYVAD